MPESEKFLRDNFTSLLHLKDDIDADTLKSIITHLQKYIEENGKDIKTNQLRNIFSKVKSKEVKDNPNSLQLLRPRLAYIAARQRKKGAENMVMFFNDLIENEVENKEDVKGFVDFFEMVIAYHKYFGFKHNWK